MIGTSTEQLVTGKRYSAPLDRQEINKQNIHIIDVNKTPSSSAISNNNSKYLSGSNDHNIHVFNIKVEKTVL